MHIVKKPLTLNNMKSNSHRRSPLKIRSKKSKGSQHKKPLVTSKPYVKMSYL